MFASMLLEAMIMPLLALTVRPNSRLIVSGAAASRRRSMIERAAGATLPRASSRVRVPVVMASSALPPRVTGPEDWLDSTMIVPPLSSGTATSWVTVTPAPMLTPRRGEVDA